MPKRTRTVRKPRALPLGRFAEAMAGEASCTQWQYAPDVPFGRTVEVPHCVFDEDGARQMRRLARWLEAAAAWVEGGR